MIYGRGDIILSLGFGWEYVSNLRKISNVLRIGIPIRYTMLTHTQCKKFSDTERYTF